MKAAEKSKYERFDYVPVEHLEKGMTIVNLGIIHQIYPHKNKEEFQIIFNPSREVNLKSYRYRKGDKLMIA